MMKMMMDDNELADVVQVGIVLGSGFRLLS